MSFSVETLKEMKGLPFFYGLLSSVFIQTKLQIKTRTRDLRVTVPKKLFYSATIENIFTRFLKHVSKTSSITFCASGSLDVADT